MDLPLIKGTKTTGDFRFSENLMVNMVATADPVLGADGYVSNHFGLKRLSDVSGESRGGIYNDRLRQGFRVIGNTLYEVNNAGEVTNSIGFIAGSGQVSMPFSFNTQAIITRSGEFYLYDNDGLRQVTDTDLGDVFDGVYIDGYYVLVDQESPIATDILNESNIRQTSYGSAEIDPDDIRGVSKWRNFLVVFGSNTMEFYENVGASPYPFSRIESYTIYCGVVGTDAKVRLPRDEGFIILGGSRNEPPSFRFAVNGNAQNITSKEIQNIIDSYTETELSEIKLEYVRNEDQEFIYCHMPKHTLLYDMTTSRQTEQYVWSILKTGWKGQQSYTGVWRGINAVKLPSQSDITWGDRFGTTVSRFDRQTPEQFDEQQEHILFSPLFRTGNTYNYNTLQPQIVNGGNAIGRDESIFLSITEDGKSFSREVAFYIGERGARFDQLLWRRVGFFNNWSGAKLRYVGKTNLTLAKLEVF